MTLALEGDMLDIDQPRLAHRHGKFSRGVVTLHIIPDSASIAKPRDEQLVALLADARAARSAVTSSPDRSIDELASIHRVGSNRIKRLIRISYLAPTIVEAVLDGNQVSERTVAMLNTVINIPLCWNEQRDRYGAA